VMIRLGRSVCKATMGNGGGKPLMVHNR